MKKTLITFLFLPVIILGAAMIAMSGEGSWMDLKNCEMCKSILEEDPALMRNMTWEHHGISNGLVSLTTVKPAYMAQYKKAGERMTKVQQKLEKGSNVMLCNMCIDMSDMLKTGKVKTEHVETMSGSVALMTSEDPKMVSRIQKWGQRTNEEMLKVSSKPELSKMPPPGKGY